MSFLKKILHIPRLFFHSSYYKSSSIENYFENLVNWVSKPWENCPLLYQHCLFSASHSRYFFNDFSFEQIIWEHAFSRAKPFILSTANQRKKEQTKLKWSFFRDLPAGHKLYRPPTALFEFASACQILLRLLGIAALFFFKSDGICAVF